MNGKFLCTSSGFRPQTFTSPGCRAAQDKSTVKPCCYPHKSGYITQVPITNKHRCAHIWAFIYEHSYMITHMCASIYEPIYEDMFPICSVRFINSRVSFLCSYMVVHIWVFIYGWSHMGTHIWVHIYEHNELKISVYKFQISTTDVCITRLPNGTRQKYCKTVLLYPQKWVHNSSTTHKQT